MKNKARFEIFRRCLIVVFMCALVFLPQQAIAQGNQQNNQNRSCNNVVACVQDKFSKKFPFDMLGNISKEEISCPKVSFSFAEIQRDFDFCFIYNFLKIIKYPIAAALLMRIYIFS